MIEAISDQIISELSALGEFKTVGPWAGEVEELLGRPHLLPSAHVVYAGGKFAPRLTLGAQALAPAVMGWSVIVMAQSLRDRTSGANSCYALLARVRAALVALDVGHGRLWPDEEALILAKGGLLAYGLDYVLDTEATE